jgi:hypothetical protein
MSYGGGKDKAMERLTAIQLVENHPEETTQTWVLLSTVVAIQVNTPPHADGSYPVYVQLAGNVQLFRRPWRMDTYQVHPTSAAKLMEYMRYKEVIG